MRATNKIIVHCTYQSHHLWNWNVRSQLLRRTPFSINRTIFGIETPIRSHQQGTRLSINRTIFGIETSILADRQREARHAINRTIFGIETVKPVFLECLCILSIAPSLELKQVKQKEQLFAFWLSIAPSLELKQLFYTVCYAPFFLLSIAPSLELKRINPCKIPRKCINYQSHHLWNWNMIAALAKIYRRVYQSHHLWNWNNGMFCHESGFV